MAGLYTELFYAIIPTLFPCFADPLSLHLVTFFYFCYHESYIMGTDMKLYGWTQDHSPLFANANPHFALTCEPLNHDVIITYMRSIQRYMVQSVRYTEVHGTCANNNGCWRAVSTLMRMKHLLARSFGANFLLTELLSPWKTLGWLEAHEDAASKWTEDAQCLFCGLRTLLWSHICAQSCAW